MYKTMGAVLVALILSGCNEPPKTPAAPVLDKSKFIEDCMTYGGERVGDCMNYLSWEA
jgi:hypothetical protein